MEKMKRISFQSTVAAGAIALALAGCSAAAPAAPPSSSSSPGATAEPDRVDPAVQLVTEYLDAIASDDIAAAWALLSPETQEIYVTEQVYAEARASNGSVGAEDASLLADSELVSYAVPDSMVTQVSASADTVADAWIVRDTDAGPRIDDVGQPSTGQTEFDWQNPDVAGGGAFDPASPASIYFPYVYAGDTLMAEPPRTITGWLDGVPATVTLEAAAGSGAKFVVDSPAASGQVLTIAWLLDAASPLWRTTTIVL